MRAGSALIALLLVSGCAFPRAVSEMAVDYNEAVARSSNELTLLNIVRAQKRQPLHFTAISALRGSISVSATGSTNVALPASARSTARNAAGDTTGSTLTEAANVLTPNASLNVQSGPSFDVGVLNSQEFTRGVLQPVPPQVVDYYLEQGWPRDFIAALFIERVELRAARDYPGFNQDDVILTIDNRPDWAENSAGFARFLSCYGLRATSTREADAPIAPYDDLKDRSTLGDLGILAANHLAIRTVTDAAGVSRRMVVSTGAARPGLGLDTKPAGTEGCLLSNAGDDTRALYKVSIATGSQRAARDPTTRPGDLAGREALGQITVQGGAAVIERDGKRYDATTRIVLRSPLGVLYFLGEYTRTNNPYPVEDGPLLVVHEGSNPGAFVRTQLDGTDYSISREGGGRSLQTLSIVEQILNLQKSASELPSTGAVQVIR